MEASTMYFAAWIATIIAYIWGVIYAVGRLEGELNGLGKRLDMLQSDLRTLTNRVVEMERTILFTLKKEKADNGGSKDTGSKKSVVYGSSEGR